MFTSYDTPTHCASPNSPPQLSNERVDPSAPARVRTNHREVGRAVRALEVFGAHRPQVLGLARVAAARARSDKLPSCWASGTLPRADRQHRQDLGGVVKGAHSRRSCHSPPSRRVP